MKKVPKKIERFILYLKRDFHDYTYSGTPSYFVVIYFLRCATIMSILLKALSRSYTAGDIPLKLKRMLHYQFHQKK